MRRIWPRFASIKPVPSLVKERDLKSMPSNFKTFVTKAIVRVVECHLAGNLEQVFHESRVGRLNDQEVNALAKDASRCELRARSSKTRVLLKYTYGPKPLIGT